MLLWPMLSAYPIDQVMLGACLSPLVHCLLMPQSCFLVQ